MEGYKDNSGFNAVFGSSGGGSSPSSSNYYGLFNSMLIQTQPSAYVTNNVAIENTIISNGISVLPDGSLQFDNSGTYQINATLQLNYIASTGTDNAYFYLLKNASDLATTTRFVVMGNTLACTNNMILTLTYMVDVLAGDRITLVWLTEFTTDIILVSSSLAPAFPDQPSVMVQVFSV